MGTLVAKSNLAQFDIILGRLTAKNACYGKAKVASTGKIQEGYGEVVAMRVTDGVSTIHYELLDEQQHVVILVIDTNQVSMHRSPRNESGVRPLQYDQDAQGRVTLVIGEGDEQTTHKARSLWHLLLMQRDICRAELLPCLNLLRSNWRIVATAEAAQRRLFTADDSSSPSREELALLVRDLGAAKYSQRQTADKKLRQMGVRLLSYAESLPPRSLTAEQRFRLQRILNSLRFNNEDSIERVAMWLREDRSLWFHYLSKGDTAQRWVAHRQLCRICGEKLDFSPAADVTERRAQLARLATRVFER